MDANECFYVFRAFRAFRALIRENLGNLRNPQIIPAPPAQQKELDSAPAPDILDE